MRAPIPLSRRKVDWVLLGFFFVNLTFISYVVSLEQVVITDPANFAYPFWPPRPLVDLIHWWERTYDPLLWARPPWYRATIWLDVLVFGPFYTLALFAFAKGREWIRQPAFLWAGLMTANVTIILFEELLGPHASPAPWVVVMANGPWLLFPFAVTARLWKPHPFTVEGP